METNALRIPNKFLKKFLDCPHVRKDNDVPQSFIQQTFIEPVLYVLTYPKSQWITKKVFEHFFLYKTIYFLCLRKKNFHRKFQAKTWVII